MNKSPLKQVQERFESKDQLVARVKDLAAVDLWLDRLNDVKGLDRVSNAKLLRLHDALERAKNEFGTRAKLVDAILKLDNRAADAGYRQRLERYPLPRLLDLHAASGRRAKRASAQPKTKAPATKKPARSRKAQGKARQAAHA